MMLNEQWIGPELEKLRRNALMRHVRPCPRSGGRKDEEGRSELNFSSNDYLDFRRRHEIVTGAKAALERDGCGTGASRLMSGTLPQHRRLESETARYKGYPDALIFGSGFLANAGAIPALAGRADTILVDRLVHASILDGSRLSRGRIVRFRHNDTDHLQRLLEKKEKKDKDILIVTESVFSMDGDPAPLEEIARLAGRYNAMLMVDEAHATGVFGPGGSGLVRELGLEAEVNVTMGTYSKALGNYGGFVACSEQMRAWLVNRARSFIFSTSPPPSVIGGCLAALQVLQSEPGLGKRLLERAEAFRTLLERAGLDTGASRSQIVPIIVGTN